MIGALAQDVTVVLNVEASEEELGGRLEAEEQLLALRPGHFHVLDEMNVFLSAEHEVGLGRRRREHQKRADESGESADEHVEVPPAPGIAWWGAAAT